MFALYVMRYLALVLILSSIVIYIRRPLGLYDSLERRDASRQYFDAPSEATRTKLKEIRQRERKEMTVSSLLSAALFGAGVVLLRSKPSTEIGDNKY